MLEPAVLAVLLVAGMATGATGIGGVFAVPALTALGGVAPLTAVAASSCAFGANGLAAWLGRPRVPTAEVRPLASLVVGALAGAAAGAAIAAAVPGTWLRGVVALIALASGLHALLAAMPDATRPLPAVMPGAVLGCAIGIGSALTGTGGPVLLLPCLMLLRVTLPVAIAAAQIIQLPVAIAATAVHAASGRLDWSLGAAVAVVLLGGWYLGRATARRMTVGWLRRLVAACLVATGVWYGWPFVRMALQGSTL